jgi:hypothetical protein
MPLEPTGCECRGLVCHPGLKPDLAHIVRTVTAGVGEGLRRCWGAGLVVGPRDKETHDAVGSRVV